MSFWTWEGWKRNLWEENKEKEESEGMRERTGERPVPPELNSLWTTETMTELNNEAWTVCLFIHQMYRTNNQQSVTASLCFSSQVERRSLIPICVRTDNRCNFQNKGRNNVTMWSSQLLFPSKIRVPSHFNLKSEWPFQSYDCD